MRPNVRLFSGNASLHNYFAYTPIRNRIPARLREMVLSWILHPDWAATASKKPLKMRYTNYTKHSKYSLDEPLISKMLRHSNEILTVDNRTEIEKASKALLGTMRKFVMNRVENGQRDLKVRFGV